MEDTIQSNPGDKQIMLYKFYSPDTLIALENQTLAFTPPRWFNDPFEFFPRIIRDQHSEKLLSKTGVFTKKQAERYRRACRRENQTYFTKSEFDKLIKDKQADIRLQARKEFDTYAQDIANQLLDILSRTIGILCLTKSWRSPLMWGHYSLGFQGFCVGYSLPAGSKALPRIEVMYSDERFPLKEADVLRNTISPEDVDSIIARKALHWKYEEEVRYIVDLNYPRLLPKENKKQFYLKHDPHRVQEILVGMRSSDEFRKELYRLARHVYPHAKIYETQPDLNSFDISRFVTSESI
jgi:hypothetical protein